MAGSVFPMTPRGSNYERLEGGMGPSHAGNRLQWKKLALGCVALIGLVWLFSPRSDFLPVSQGPEEDLLPSTPYTTTGPSDSYDDETTDDTDLSIFPTPPASVPASPAIPSLPPASPETDDPDPLKTVHCTTPYSSASPLVQYALMVDAGSTGSRIHIYKFHNCGPAPAFEYEVFMQIQPGLSAYSGEPRRAAESLDVLLDEAVRVVPASLRSCTPLAVKATAGLRQLGAWESADILRAVERRLRERYPFPLPNGDAVAIMDGKDEGVYAWITANYLLGTIRADTSSSSPSSLEEDVATNTTTPYAVLDLGGGSTQIVFEPERGSGEKPDAVLQDGEHKYELRFGGSTRVLYQHSYLGYGLKSARRSVHLLVDFMDSVRNHHEDDDESLPRIPNPCLSRGTEKEVEIAQDNRDKKTVLMAGEDVGGFEACNRIIELVMAKDAVCELKPCSFDGVYQPSLLDAFPTGKILLLSYFYDRITPLLGASDGPQPRLSIDTISRLATQVCAGQESWEQHWGDSPDVMSELQGRPEWCLDLTFMHGLLVLGYEFRDTREVELGKRVDGTELGWCLGATIAMVSGGEVHCQV